MATSLAVGQPVVFVQSLAERPMYYCRGNPVREYPAQVALVSKDFVLLAVQAAGMSLLREVSIVEWNGDEEAGWRKIHP